MSSGKMEEENLYIKLMSVKLELKGFFESDFKINHITDMCWFGQLSWNLFILQMLIEHSLTCHASITLGTRDK